MASAYPKGFPIYDASKLRKVNSLRRAISGPAGREAPLLGKAQVLFSTAEHNHGEPSSCYNCHMFNSADSTCSIHPADVKIRKFVYPPTATADAKQIEYWPCCGMQDYGEPNSGTPCRISENDPDNTGLLWINAPRVGQEHGGANCGGEAGGDDCDYFVLDGDGDKRQACVGFCRVLQTYVANGDRCSAWNDDDKIPWNRAQDILKELDK